MIFTYFISFCLLIRLILSLICRVTCAIEIDILQQQLFCKGTHTCVFKCKGILKQNILSDTRKNISLD